MAVRIRDEALPRCCPVARHLGSQAGVTTPYLDLQYQYNALGQIERIDDLRNPTTDLSNSAIYGYDGLGRLTSVDWLPGASYDESFSYDPLGNLTALGGKVLSYPGRPHQALLRSDGTEMLYDSNGSRSQKRTPAETQGYVYDGLGRLSAGNLSPTPTDPPTKTVQFTYDAGANRVARVITANGVTRPTRRYFNPFVESYDGGATKYYHFGDRLVASRDIGDTTLSEAPPGSAAEPFRPPRVPFAVGIGALGLTLLLVWGPGRGRVRLGVSVAPSRAAGVATTVLIASMPVLLAPQCGGGGGPPGFRRFHFDHLGSLQAVSDANGSLWRQARYRPYGIVRGRYDAAGTAAPADEKTRHEFIGYQTEIDTGLEYAYARFYDPDLGQFLSHDPVGEFPSPYAYTHGDPINFSDPTGEEIVTLSVLAILTVLWIAKTSYNYARSGDWQFALEEGVQTPVPTEGPEIGPIQQAAVVRIGLGGVRPGERIESGADEAGAVLALRQAASLAQAGSGDAPYCKDPEYCQEGRDTGRSPRSPDLADLAELYGFLRAAGALARGAISAIGRIAARRGVQAAERVGSQAAERYSAETLAKVERQLKEHGRRSLERSRRSLQKNIERQQQDIERYREAGGYTSSVEREIRAFESELRAIEDVLGR